MTTTILKPTPAQYDEAIQNLRGRYDFEITTLKRTIADLQERVEQDSATIIKERFEHAKEISELQKL
jgi:hypothetical protein